MELEPQPNTSADVSQEELSGSAPPPSIFGRAAASIEKATASRNAAAASGASSSESFSPADKYEAPEFKPDKVMHRAELVEPQSSLPVPAGPVRVSPGAGQQPGSTSLWKRIKMRTRRQDSSSDRAEVTAHLNSIEGRLEALGEVVQDRLRALSERLDEVWECEEQLSHLVDIQDKLQQMVKSQSEVTQALAAATRRIVLLTGCVVALAGVVGLGLVAQFQ